MELFSWTPALKALLVKGLRPWPKNRPLVLPRMLSETASLLSSAPLRRSSEAMNPTAVVWGGPCQSVFVRWKKLWHLMLKESTW